MKQIEYFRFEAIPEHRAFSELYPCGVPMFRIDVHYGGKRYGLTIPAYNEEMMLTDSFLEHLVQHAVNEFRKCAQKEAQEKKQAKIDQARERVDKEITELIAKARDCE